METPRRSWPRIVLTIAPETRDALHALALRNYRDPKREATRLLLDAIARETKAAASR